MKALSPEYLQAFKKELAANPLLATIRQSKGDNMGLAPLHMACLNGNLDVARELIHHPGVSAWDTDLFGRTSLHYALCMHAPKTELGIANQLELCRELKVRMNE